jgi:hypothetical protein
MKPREEEEGRAHARFRFLKNSLLAAKVIMVDMASKLHQGGEASYQGLGGAFTLLGSCREMRLDRILKSHNQRFATRDTWLHSVELPVPRRKTA